MGGRRILSLIAAAAVCALARAAAEPMRMGPDLENTVTVEMNDRASYIYAYRYPQADPDDPSGEAINAFYQYLADDAEGFTIPMNADYYRSMDPEADIEVRIDYEITCNNDDFLSVLIRTRQDERETCAGHTFSRKGLKAGNTVALPYLLGLLDSGENDTWLQERQTRKADDAVREMVWERLNEQAEGTLPAELDEETLARIFYPEEDFYLDQSGNPVFYLQPGTAGEGLTEIPISLEDILDEL